MNFKNSKKMMLSVSVAFLLVFSIFMSLFLFSTDVKAAVYGPKYYYLSIERQHLKNVFKDFKQSYIEKNLSEFSYTGSIKAALNGDYVSSDEDLKKLADFLSKLDLSFNYNMNGKNIDDIYYTADISTKYDGKALADIDVKSANNKTVIKLPGLTDKSIKIISPSLSSKFNKAIFKDDDKAFEELFGITRDSYNKLLAKYINNIIVKQIPNEKVTYLSDVKYQNTLCNSITFNIDEDTMAKIYKSLAAELRKDKEFKKLYKSINNSFNEFASEAYQIDPQLDINVDYDIEQMCDGLENAAEELGDVNVAYTAYFTNSGDILFRQFDDRINDAKIALESYTNEAGSEILNFNVNAGDESLFGFSNEKKLVNGNYTGKFNFQVSDKPIVEADYTYEKDAKVGNLNTFVGEVKGTVNLEQFNKSDENQLSNINFALTNHRKGENTLTGEAKVSTKIDNKSLEAVFSTEIKQSDVTDITKPYVSTWKSIDIFDFEGMSEMGSDVYEKLYEKFPDLLPDPNAQEDSVVDDSYDNEYNNEYNDVYNY